MVYFYISLRYGRVATNAIGFYSSPKWSTLPLSCNFSQFPVAAPAFPLELRPLGVSAASVLDLISHNAPGSVVPAWGVDGAAAGTAEP